MTMKVAKKPKNPLRKARQAAIRMLEQVGNGPAEEGGRIERVGLAIDRAVMALSPTRGRRRLAERLRTAALAYAGAARGRIHSTWNGVKASADSDLLDSGDLAQLRARSRQLVRDDPHAASMVRVMSDNVVGAGIRAQSRASAEETGLSESAVEEWNRACDQVFDAWAESKESDATGHTDFYELQRLIYETMKVDGDALVHPVSIPPELEPNRLLATSLELIDADRLASPSGNREEIRDGVEIGARGQAIAYHVSKGHPGDMFSSAFSQDFMRIRRFREGQLNMLHFFRRQRPGQTRGAPVLTPALTAFQNLSKYIEYEQIAARVNASIALFITQNDPETATVTFDTEEQKFVEGIEPGAIERLGPGENIEPFNANRPGTTFDPYVIRMLRAIGAAVGLPYELFARDASRVNYTSSRTLLLEAWRGFRCDQAALVSCVLGPVREMVLVEGYARGLLPTVEGFGADPLLRRALLRAAWIPPARGWVDPVKEIEASAAAVAANLSTHADEAAGNGRDFAETARINARNARMLLDLEKEFKLPPGTLTGGGQKQAAAPPADDADPDEGEEEVPAQ